ncbi:hypothetical protein GCM10023170_014460 [Phytohabitans houttuyneae]|uniref:Uncharacterized protein n=1 Tax=Phytohabitans houttuyneae TaxID=1076126 RepID=A0A6V8L033_9ACTN|nr:hypothetical protein Phou_103150 [Phytohabitans houttuyneae]
MGRCAPGDDTRWGGYSQGKRALGAPAGADVRRGGVHSADALGWHPQGRAAGCPPEARWTTGVIMAFTAVIMP